MSAVDQPLWGIVGPTGTGKTELAIEICEAVAGEIVSVDSAQVFRGLDVGTAKPTPAEQDRIRHHLIDVIDPNTQWSAARFADAADRAIAEIRSRQKTPVLCGGTGLWLRALVRGVFEAPAIDPKIRETVREDLLHRGSKAMHEELQRVDPVAASRLHPNDPQRIGRALEFFRQTKRPISEFQDAHRFQETRYGLVGVAIDWDRETLRERVRSRAETMYESGLVEEVERALSHGARPDGPGLSIIGYRDVVRHLKGELTRSEALESTVTDTRRYAKRQRNWFNSESNVRWIPPDTRSTEVLKYLRSPEAPLP